MAENTDQVVVRVALRKKKEKIYKIQTLVIQYIHVLHQYFTLKTNKLLNQLTC